MRSDLARQFKATSALPFQSLVFLAIAIQAHCLPTANASEATFTRVVTEKSLGSVELVELTKIDSRKPHFWISPDGRRFAYALQKGMVIDGEKFEFDYGLKHETFVFSPDSKRTAFVAKSSRPDSGGRNEVLIVDGKEASPFYSNITAVAFSPSSEHVAAIVRLKASTFEHAVLIDGREFDATDASFTWELAFTPDSNSFVYGVEVDDRYQMRVGSADGSGPPLPRGHAPAKLTGNFFSANGGPLGYIASDAKHNKFVVFDGKEGERFKEIEHNSIVISGDGRHIAYVGEPQSFREVVVINGKPSKVYGGLEGGDLVKDTLSLSHDGRRSAYAVENRNKVFIVLDGKPGKIYDGVGRTVFSPDGKYAAYLALVGDKVMSVVEGREGERFDDRGPAIFSPDGKSAAFWAEAKRRQFVVHNGKKHPIYDQVSRPAFSSDGQRLCYSARTGKKWRFVGAGNAVTGSDSKPGAEYDYVEPTSYFSDDSSRVAVVVCEGESEKVVVNGVPGEPYSMIVTLAGGKVHFDGSDRLHYLAVRDNEMFLVEESIEPASP